MQSINFMQDVSGEYGGGNSNLQIGAAISGPPQNYI
jgi:hypothetical protein